MVNKITKKVELIKPIDVEEGEPIKSVELREPRAGEMRGLSFTNIMQLDVDTMTVLIPRISDLTERQMLNLSPVNMTPLFTGVVGFFVHIDSPSE
ncbi:phage tail assembly protein [Psychromonas hadalis]|uniref:phage tail assembly protein n=1 Tax=Psychromonas hadalis TaxID=211669 RepID=UPI0003B3AB79|nr:phage tail assembly protein [Psychromonas hadalis]